MVEVRRSSEMYHEKDHPEGDAMVKKLAFEEEAMNKVD